MRRFFDTNVLVYSHDLSQGVKRARALELIAASIAEDGFVVSTQVLVEFYATCARRKLLRPADALEFVRLWGEHDVVPQSRELIFGGLELHQEHSISLWDGLIVQAAIDARCDVLLSEDLQHGRRFGSLEVVNPFIAAAHEAAATYKRSTRKARARA